ncbi:MAG: AbrB/MazE/SpoVT family DNA-binding domain-containing protein [Candidatus Omnitrophota bacterium]
MTIKEKKLFKHGGSLAIDLPSDFAKNAGDKVTIQYDNDTLIVRKSTDLDTIESEPEFKTFVKVLLEDALKNPKKLKAMDQVWGKEWDELLKGVEVDDE